MCGTNFLYRVHNFFVVPEGYSEQPAALAITEGDKVYKAVHLLELCAKTCSRKKRMASSSVAGEASSVLT